MTALQPIETPYLIFLGDAPDDLTAKTGGGLVQWRRDSCVGQLRLPACGCDLGLPDMSVEQAREAGARTLVIGIANPGGFIPESWLPSMKAAIAAGLDIASGLHNRLNDNAELAALAEKHGTRLIDLRIPPKGLRTGKGKKRTGKRVLTVGTDCAIGKKYTALALTEGLKAHGVNATFRATGQTGILIDGTGLPMDCIIGDFISGAAEIASPDNEPDHWDVIEGQGSLLHPSYAGVTLGLLHGSQPDCFIVCHEPTRTNMRDVAAPIAKVEDIIRLTIELGRLTNPDIRCAGISVNTHRLEEAEARSVVDAISKEHNLPASDPVRFGVTPLIEGILA